MDPMPAFPGKLATPVISALRRILRPLVRLLLTHGVTYPLITDIVKSTYVDVARREFRLSGKRQTDSRISLLTGVHRKDVKRLIEEGDGGGEAATGVSLGAALVARWLGAPELSDEEGRPLPLPRLKNNRPFFHAAFRRTSEGGVFIFPLKEDSLCPVTSARCSSWNPVSNRSSATETRS